MSEPGPTAQPSVFLSARQPSARSMRSGLSKSIEDLSTVLYSWQAERRRQKKLADVVSEVLAAYAVPRGCGIPRTRPSSPTLSRAGSRPGTAPATGRRPVSRPTTATSRPTSAAPVRPRPVTASATREERAAIGSAISPARPGTAPLQRSPSLDTWTQFSETLVSQAEAARLPRPTTAPSQRLMTPLDRSPRKRPVSASTHATTAALNAATTASLLHPFSLRDAYLQSQVAQRPFQPELEPIRVLVAETRPGEDPTRLSRRQIGRQYAKGMSCFLHHKGSK